MTMNQRTSKTIEQQDIQPRHIVQGMHHSPSFTPIVQHKLDGLSFKVFADRDMSNTFHQLRPVQAPRVRKV